MTVTDQLRAAARAEYLLVRTCLTTIDRRFVVPLEGRVDGFDNAMAKVRTVLDDVDERLSGTARTTEQPESVDDALTSVKDSATSVKESVKDSVKTTVEELTDQSGTSDTDSDQSEQAAKPAKTESTKSESTKTKADSTKADSTKADAKPVPTPPAEGSAVLDTAEVEQVEELAEEYLETEADHLTGELAENDDLREVQARLRAKHALQEHDEQR